MYCKMETEDPVGGEQWNREQRGNGPGRMREVEMGQHAETTTGEQEEKRDE